MKEGQESHQAEERQKLEEVELQDDNVWSDDRGHPGTEAFRRAIRMVAEDCPDKKYTRQVYTAVKKELEGRTFNNGGKDFYRLRECSEDELIGRIGDAFHAENKVQDDNVWFDDRRHPGTKAFRRAIRLVAEDYPDNKYTRQVYMSVKKELEGRKFYKGKAFDRLRECSEDELIGLIGDSFHAEKEHHLEKKNSKSSLFDEESRTTSKRSLKKESMENKMSERSPKTKGELGTNSKRSLRGEEADATKKSSSQRNALDCSSDDERKDSRPEKGNSKRRIEESFSDDSDQERDIRKDRSSKSLDQRKRRNSSRRLRIDESDSDSDNRTRTSDSENQREQLARSRRDQNLDVYLEDSANHPGTLALRATVRRVVSESGRADFSRTIYKRILREMDGRKFFRSRNSKKEVEKGGIFYVLYTIYEEEKYLMRVRSRDVYFEATTHPGTRAWVRAVQQVVIKQVDLEYCKDTYREIKKRLHDSSFFVGEPPDCEQATKDDLIEIFGDRFELEKKKRERRIRVSRKGLSSYNEPLQIRRASEEEASTRQSAIERGAIVRNDHPRPIPGYLYWRQLGHAISSRYSRWGWLHRTHRQIGQQVASWPFVVSCRGKCRPCLKVKQLCRTDPRPGKMWYEKIAGQLEVTMFGQTSSWPLLVLLGMMFAFIVIASWHSVLKLILFEFI